MVGFNLKDIPPDIQQELYENLQKKFKRRDNPHISREDKLKATADVLHSLVGLSLSQQRGILLFTISIIEDTQHSFWRDNHHQVMKSKKRKKGGQNEQF